MINKDDLETIETIMGKEKYDIISKVRPGIGNKPTEAEELELENRKKEYGKPVKFNIFSESSEIKIVNWNEYFLFFLKFIVFGILPTSKILMEFFMLLQKIKKSQF